MKSWGSSGSQDHLCVICHLTLETISISSQGPLKSKLTSHILQLTGQSWGRMRVGPGVAHTLSSGLGPDCPGQAWKDAASRGFTDPELLRDTVLF